MKDITDIKRHEIIPKQGTISLNLHSSMSPVVGSPPASVLGCERNPFYLFLWVLTTNVLHIAIRLSLQMFKLHIIVQLGPPCLCSSSKFPVWVPLFCHCLSFIVSSFLFFHTLVFWLQFLTCVAFTALIPMFLIFLFPESISLLIDYSIFSMFNLLALSLRFLVPACSFPQQSSFAICFLSLCQMLWCFFHISRTSTSLDHQWRNTLRL